MRFTFLLLYFIARGLTAKAQGETGAECSNDYCTNQGHCYYVSDYLVPISSFKCPSGWFSVDSGCYKVLWNESQVQDAEIQCNNISSTLIGKVTKEDLIILSQKLQILMNAMEVVEQTKSLDLLTSDCQVDGAKQCKRIIPPYYNDTNESIWHGLPLCKLKAQTNNLKKQCKCPKTRTGTKCESVQQGSNVEDYSICQELTCPGVKSKLFVEFSSYGVEYMNMTKCPGLKSPTKNLTQPNCSSPNSLSAVKYWCQGKHRCNISHFVNGNNPILGNVCNSQNPKPFVVRTSCRKNITTCIPMIPNTQIEYANNTCWNMVQKKMNWWEALDYCKQHGGSLAFVPPNATHFPSPDLLAQLSKLPFDIWIDKDTQNMTIRTTTADPEECPYLHINPEDGTATRRPFDKKQKLSCSMGTATLPWVCSFPVQPNGTCPDNTKKELKRCYKMFDDTQAWHHAKANCNKFHNGDLIQYSEVNEKIIQDIIKEKILQYWIAGQSDDSRDPDKSPIPCSISSVSGNVSYFSNNSIQENCTFKTVKQFALCALPPTIESETSTSTSTIPVTTTTVTPTISDEKSCKEKIINDSRGITVFKETPGNQMQFEVCPGDNVSGYAKWYCNGKTGEFEPPLEPNWLDCKTINLTDIINNKDTPEEKAEDLLQQVIREKERPLFGSDLKNVLNVLDHVQEQHETYEYKRDKNESSLNITNVVTEIVQELLTEHNQLAWLDYKEEFKRVTVSNQLIYSVEKAGFSLAAVLNNRSYTFKKKSFVLEVANYSKSCYADKQISSAFEEGSITIPSNIVEDETIATIVTKYNNLTLLLPTTEFQEGDQNNTYKLNSAVLGVSIQSNNEYLFSKGEFVEIVLKHYEKVKLGAQVTCVFWNTLTKQWSINGCWNKTTNETHTICNCKHLTNFAVLMDVHNVLQPDSIHIVILSWITIVGCSISIVCLTISCIIFIAFRSLWSLRSTIHANLCGCLAISELLLMIGLERTENKEVCALIAGLLHFSWLSAFTWIALEGVHIYVLLIKVFDTAEQKTWLYYIAGYGIPTLIVTISASVNPRGYGTDRYCWLSKEKGFIFSFAAPMLLAILFNSVIFVLAMKAAASVKVQRASGSMVEKTKLWIRRSASLIPLLGLSWLFGFLYVDENSLVFSYFFAIFNSAQGIFIFIFHCVRNEKVQQVVARYISQQKNMSASLFLTKSRSNSCTATSSVRTTTSSDDASVPAIRREGGIAGGANSFLSREPNGIKQRGLSHH